MIGRISCPIEVPNDQAWDTFGFRCFDDAGAEITPTAFTAYMRLASPADSPEIELTTDISGNEASVQMSEVAMADIDPETYHIECQLVFASVATRQIRGSIIIVGPV